MCETTVHAICGCTGRLKHYLRKSFMKPTLVIECQAQGKGCNIGRRKTINLTKAISLELEDKTVQCSAVSAKLTGAVFQSGLNMTQFKRSLRRSGLKVSNTKVDQVVDTYMEATQREYDEQQQKNKQRI